MQQLYIERRCYQMIDPCYEMDLVICLTSKAIKVINAVHVEVVRLSSITTCDGNVR